MTDRKIPRDKAKDYAPAPIKARQEFGRALKPRNALRG
jgi:hypothetical protein